MYDFLAVRGVDKLKHDHIVNVPAFSTDLVHKDVRDLCVKASKDYPYHHLDLDNEPTRKTKFFDIYFSDLNDNAQKRLLETVGADGPEEINWNIDIIPIASFEFEPDLDTMEVTK